MKTKRWNYFEKVPKGYEAGHRVALIASRGRKNMKLIVIDADGLKLKTVPLTEEKYITDMPHSTKKAWKQAARKSGTTKSAKRALREVMA